MEYIKNLFIFLFAVWFVIIVVCLKIAVLSLVIEMVTGFSLLRYIQSAF